MAHNRWPTGEWPRQEFAFSVRVIACVLVVMVPLLLLALVVSIADEDDYYHTSDVVVAWLRF